MNMDELFILENDHNYSIKKSNMNLFDLPPPGIEENNSNSSQVKFHEMTSRYSAKKHSAADSEDNDF